MDSGAPLRLLWPTGHSAAAVSRLTEVAAADLSLEAVIAAMVLPETPPTRQAFWR